MTTDALIIKGDCLNVMAGLPAASVHCCVTSPPYWGLRDYGVDGQLGLEKTPDEYVAKMVAMFREVRRILRDDGTLWLNLGDSYAGHGAFSQSATDKDIRHATVGALLDKAQRRVGGVNGLKPKDLVGIPWRVAFALQDDGWWLRQDIIWHKPNPMPESVRDRCTKAHEYVFLLTKSERYYYDSDAVSEALAETSIGRANRKQKLMDTNGVGTLGKQIINGVDSSHAYAGLAIGRNGKTGYNLESKTRNRRSVWTISTKPFSGAHFAVMPPDLVEPCILAGCPTDGVVFDPFTGSGTVGAVALKHGRNFIGSELNPEYAEIARRRIDHERNKTPLFSNVI